MQQLWHPQIEVFDPPDFPDADRHVGEGPVRKLIDSYLALGWDGQLRVEEYLDAGEEVVVIWRMKGRSAIGDYPVDEVIAHVYLFERGKLRRARQYLRREEALEAAGLRE